MARKPQTGTEKMLDRIGIQYGDALVTQLPWGLATSTGTWISTTAVPGAISYTMNELTTNT